MSGIVFACLLIQQQTAVFTRAFSFVDLTNYWFISTSTATALKAMIRCKSKTGKQ